MNYELCFAGLSNAAAPDSPLLPFPAAPGNLANATGHIRDTLAGLHFDISPSAFFQVRGCGPLIFPPKYVCQLLVIALTSLRVCKRFMAFMVYSLLNQNLNLEVLEAPSSDS